VPDYRRLTYIACICERGVDQASGERIDVVIFGSDGYFGPATLTNRDLVDGEAMYSMIQLPDTIGAPILSMTCR
jgi:hypothetical protein